MDHGGCDSRELSKALLVGQARVPPKFVLCQPDSIGSHEVGVALALVRDRIEDRSQAFLFAY